MRGIYRSVLVAGALVCLLVLPMLGQEVLDTSPALSLLTLDPAHNDVNYRTTFFQGSTPVLLSPAAVALTVADGIQVISFMVSLRSDANNPIEDVIHEGLSLSTAGLPVTVDLSVPGQVSVTPKLSFVTSDWIGIIQSVSYYNFQDDLLDSERLCEFSITLSDGTILKATTFLSLFSTPQAPSYRAECETGIDAVDVVMVLDSSSGAGIAGWNYVKALAANIVDSLDIASDKTRFASLLCGL